MLDFKWKSALITGGWGFIGTILVEKLVRLGVKVTVIDVKPPPFYFSAGLDSITWVQNTLSHQKSFEKIDDVDVVFHLAGSADVRKSVEDPEGDFKANVASTFKLLNWARHRDVKRFIFTSSVSVVDPYQERPYSEKVVITPSSPYGAAKATCEAYCCAYARSYKLYTIAARLFNVYGPYTKRLFVADAARMILEGIDEIKLWGGGTQVRDYLYIEDVADGLLFLSEKGEIGEVYNLASGEPITLSNLAKRLARALNGKDIRVLDRGPTYPGDIMEWYADIGKIKQIGFSPKHSLDIGLTRTAQWIIANREWFLSDDTSPKYCRTKSISNTLAF